jgi:hypothetical protein
MSFICSIIFDILVAGPKVTMSQVCQLVMGNECCWRKNYDGESSSASKTRLHIRFTVGGWCILGPCMTLVEKPA